MLALALLVVLWLLLWRCKAARRGYGDGAALRRGEGLGRWRGGA
ncbi:hypothetical protein ACFYL6_08720 [Micromonospora sp. NPDC007208]